ncbi:hypothetical protein [Paraglaciecola sp. T6c]|uniref:hypothetical protein n=1 Tax=Pseudoalteromonas atlantica (strain T6c / ATCC BAA-1087) TaxID=3042615 RepID=UPI0002F6BCD7|nr:hypothetical protein [Paraglaciecola sp. T6c]
MFGIALLICTHARADFYIVAHSSNQQQSLSQKEAVNLFMGRSRAFANGEFALVFDLPRSKPVSGAFYRALTGLSMAQVNSYWSRLMFSGQNMPPQPLPNERAMIDIIKRNPSAIGWLTSVPKDENLRVLLILKELS